MSKIFKKGDRVIRIGENHHKCIKGHVYTVKYCRDDLAMSLTEILEGYGLENYLYDPRQFKICNDLLKKETLIREHNYYIKKAKEMKRLLDKFD